MKRLLLALALLAAPISAYAAAVQVESLMAGLLYNGVPLSGGKVYTYQAGTTTAAPTWSNSTKTATNTNPITLDIQGRAPVYAEGQYKFVVKDSDGVTVATFDNLTYSSSVAPSALTVGALTALSATVNQFYSPNSILASATISASLLSNSRLSNNTLLASPTQSYHIVDYGTYLAGLSASNATMSAHIANNTNPHGGVLHQAELIASTVHALQLIPYGNATPSNEGIIPAYLGEVVFSDNVGQGIGFASAPVYSVASADFLLAHALNGDWEIKDRYFNYLVFASSTRTLSFGGENEIHFNGATLTNFVFSPTTFEYIASNTYPHIAVSLTPYIDTVLASSVAPFGYVQYAEASGSEPNMFSTEEVVASLTIPASFTAGYYRVDWLTEVKFGYTPYALASMTLAVNSTDIHVRQQVVQGDASFPPHGQVVGHAYVHLSPNDILYVKAECAGTMFCDLWQISAQFLSSTRFAP